MFVYHLGHTKFARSLNGEGAKLHGGRWNRVGVPCIYTSESKALCILEYAANVRLEEMPTSLSITTYDLPEKSIKELNLTELPTQWQDIPSPEENKQLGSELLKDVNVLAIRVPSVIVSSEFNFILNPLATKFETIKITDVHIFTMDKRIKK